MRLPSGPTTRILSLTGDTCSEKVITISDGGCWVTVPCTGEVRTSAAWALAGLDGRASTMATGTSARARAGRAATNRKPTATATSKDAISRPMCGPTSLARNAPTRIGTASASWTSAAAATATRSTRWRPRASSAARRRASPAAITGSAATAVMIRPVRSGAGGTCTLLASRSASRSQAAQSAHPARCPSISSGAIPGSSASNRADTATRTSSHVTTG